ncbi:MAG: prephenate dehydratase domain-containing protein [Parcubacteria group bacterium]|jgi:prephenate dehydratase
MHKVYTLGPQFSYSYNLAARVFDPQNIVCVHNISDVFDQVMAQDSARGIVPIENMLTGSVRESLLSLKKYNICIERSFDLRIEHVLASQTDTYTKIASYTQPLAQCSAFVRSKKCAVVEASSTSAAMQIAAEDPSVAAIGNEEAAHHYGVPVVERQISDRMRNITRFIEIRNNKKTCTITGSKTSMIITPTEDRAGLLFEILSVFEIKGINLTKIESMPTGNKMNDYIFYIEIDGALEERRIQDALAFLRTFVTVDVFGSYNIEEV